MARTLRPSTEIVIPREFSVIAILLPFFLKETLRLVDEFPPAKPDAPEREFDFERESVSDFVFDLPPEPEKFWPRIV